MRSIALALVSGFTFVACAPSSTRTPGPGPAVGSSEAPAVFGQGAPPTLAPTTTTFPVETVVPISPDQPDQPVTPPTPWDHTVTPSLMKARPISGGTLRILSDGHTAVAADQDRDQVYVVDLIANKVTNTIALHPGDEPGRVVEDDAGRVHVALRRGGAVVTLNPTLGTILARRELCAAPRGLAFEPATKLLHVACAGGELVSIDAAPTSDTPTRTLTLTRDLRDVVVKGDRLLVSSLKTAAVTILKQTASGVQTQTLTPQPSNFGGMSAAVAWRMVDGPGDNVTVLHQRGVTGTVGTFPGGYGRGFGCGAIVDSSTSSVDAQNETITVAPGLQGALVAADVAVSPDGSQMAVVSIGGDDQGRQVQFYSTGESVTNQGFAGSGGMIPPPGKFGDCKAPDSSPTTPANDAADDGTQHTWLARPVGYLPPNGQIVAVAYDPRGNIVVQSREPATLQVLTQRQDAITLSDESRFDAGQRIFHTATANQIACASCHPEGGEDGRVWLFQNFGSRRTQSLRGGITDTAPFHWSGDENNLTSLMTDVFQGRMGGQTLNATQVAALGTWLNDIPTIPPSRWADDDTLRRGQALFTSAGCVACHSGADFTNGQNVDVGTGGNFQVPQLHGLAFRAPFIHTGCAATLHDRFTSSCAGDARHSVSTLTDAQINDLTAYLDTL
jgi:mono/diheme cytochrome c family protein